MMRMKKITAALLAVVMMVAMMSCIAVSVSAEEELSGPVMIEKVKIGLDVSGSDLDGNCFVVSSAWSGLSDGTRVNVKLDGKMYKAYIGGNAYAELADAVDNASAGMNIYLTAGTYSAAVHVKAGHLNIYGPYAGISPNKVADATNALDLKDPNPNRPAAANASNNSDEAVLNCIINNYKVGGNLTIDGVFFGGNSGLILGEGGQIRYGTHIRNCITNSSQGTIFNMGRGFNMDFVLENNRMINGKDILNIAGFGDATLRSNYFNNTGKAVHTHSLSGATMGIPITIENNYWENSGTIYSYDPTDLSYASAYTVSIKGNYVNNFVGGYIVYNVYLALKSVPGININVVGNTFKGIKSTPFKFPFNASTNNSVMARFLVNINENYFEMGKAVTFIDSEMNATLNCARNYYTSPMSVDRVVKYKDSTLVLYPYYSDPEMTDLVGGASIRNINLDAERFGVVLNQEDKEVKIDFRGENMDSIDLASILTVDEGCTWKLYKTATLEDEVKDGVVYFDGIETVRYVAVTGADGASTSVYRFYMINDLGTEAKLLSVEFDSDAVPAPEVSGSKYTYRLNAETAILNYDLHVSNGASYTLWLDSLCQASPLTDKMDGYIPYSDDADNGYTVYVKVVSEDGNATEKYTLEFIRPRSVNYDPGIFSIVAPENNAVIRNNRKMVYYYCTGIQASETFKFNVTPGATYAIFTDKAYTREVSSSSNVRALTLKEGQNTFYIRVKDAKNETGYTLVVENGTRSSENAIVAVSGADTYSITENKIMTTSGLANQVDFTFVTASPYATVKVYADANRALPIAYTSTPTVENGHNVDERTFSLKTGVPVSKYTVVCIAENGESRSYSLEIEKTFYPNTFADVEEDKWYYDSVRAVIDMGLMNGSFLRKDAEGNDLYAFRPTAKITRQEVAVLITALTANNSANFSAVKLSYTDNAKIASWAKNAVKVCDYNGYMVGSNGAFKPTAQITRQEMMSIFARIYGLTGSADLTKYDDDQKVASWAKAGVEACVAAGIVSGSNNKLNPTGFISRAEIATMINMIDQKVGLYN